ncbi:hypothetical protein BCR37DRAFT_391684 [Protomyces lactucae-debilis]|uniref:Uncharacterized protein n=1 Tax=Protomyces lactucae-debilis TaxID=2754530 RepID=A0A1Y2FN12_PROLT|nr:uncharacterized protein BCR37DRAFT_391684 [Protomyces lactucae-debilis]ORY84967.1 hypothetical protein BCR37DRAFT_391684 [Protomyces lactucae-debilis]
MIPLWFGQSRSTQIIAQILLLGTILFLLRQIPRLPSNKYDNAVEWPEKEPTNVKHVYDSVKPTPAQPDVDRVTKHGSGKSTPAKDVFGKSTPAKDVFGKSTSATDDVSKSTSAKHNLSDGTHLKGNTSHVNATTTRSS